ncbi:MAG TPA: DNA repair exonuclease [Candidatus Obscuribacterales bacterium]
MATEIQEFKFLQLSDLHLDSAYLGTRLGLSQSQRYERTREMLESLFKAVQESQRRGVDAVVIPGDLFDLDTVTGPTMSYVADIFGRLGQIPVIIAPGNRDHHGPASLYNSAVLNARGLPLWPANVHIFDSSEPSLIHHPYRADVSFTGRAFLSPDPTENRFLAQPLPKNEQAAFNILLFHGFLEGYAGPDSAHPEKYSAPFSVDELEAQGFTFAALGHCHEFAEVYSSKEELIGAYAGSFVGRSYEEVGPRVALFVTCVRQADGRFACSLEPAEFDSRRLYVVGADISGLGDEEMLDEISLNVEDQGARAGQDLVYLHLEGSYPPSLNLLSVLEKLRARYYHLHMSDHTRPDYLGERFDERTTEWKYIEAMLELKKNAETSFGDGSSDYQMSGSTVEDALYYGLDALRQQKVNVRNVD